jgi:flagellar hook-length control protein FliK
LPSDGHAGQEALQGTRESARNLRSDTGTINISQDINLFKGRAAAQEQLKHVKDPLPSYLVDQVGKQISRSIKRGERILRLQLKPPQLGSLRVEMDMKGNILKLGMTAENSSVKDILLSSVHELKETLSEQGVKLDKIDIDISNNFGQSLANLKDGAKEGLNGGQRRTQDSNEGPHLKDESAGDEPGSEGRVVVAGSSLDLMA